MCILSISSKLLILFLLTFTKEQADSSPCQRKEKQLASLDLAKDAISKAKILQPTCVSDSKDVATNTSDCGGKEKVLAYLDNALNLIDDAKENSLTCGEANNLTNVTEEGKDISKIVLQEKPMDCSEILKNGETKSGEYVIWPKNPQNGNWQLKVYCDMDTDGGGWTVIQRRGNFQNKIDFFRNWNDYKLGFGNILEEFWIGNDNIFALTNQRNYTVRFDMENNNKEHRFAIYSSFWIEDEKADYKLHFGKYNGTAGDGFQTHKNTKFATKDKENGNLHRCAATRRGGWWYENCGYSNPNAINYPGGRNDMSYMHWYPFTGYDSLMSIDIKIR